MHIKQHKFGGWENNLQLANEHAELVISLDVGPRVLSYKTPRGENVFKNYPAQMGGKNEPEWMIRGGHRCWIAPEDETLTYVLDNQPVTHDLSSVENGVRLVNESTGDAKIRKEMTVRLAPDSSQVTVLHRATNEGDKPLEIATWGLSVMGQDGIEIIPQPPLGEHPRDLLPNRLMVIWPYTDMTDARYRFGWKYITLRQAAGYPSKIGLAHKERWVAYLMRNTLFVKTFDYVEGARYPDNGCNFETFTNSEMIEIESLGPLTMLAPGESTGHAEQWYLCDVEEQPVALNERALEKWIEPKLRRLGVIPD